MFVSSAFRRASDPVRVLHKYSWKKGKEASMYKCSSDDIKNFLHMSFGQLTSTKKTGKDFYLLIKNFVFC